MIVLVLGVPDSGKSIRAESLALELAGDGPKFYIATMIPYGEEGAERVRKHRAMRDGKGFVTIECPVDLGKIELGQDDLDKGGDSAGPGCKAAAVGDTTCLLECISNLVGNEMHRQDGMKMDRTAACDGSVKVDDNEKVRRGGSDSVVERVMDGVRILAGRTSNLVIVSNEFELDGDDYDDDTREYVKLVHRVNLELRGMADRILEFQEGKWIETKND